MSAAVASTPKSPEFRMEERDFQEIRRFMRQQAGIEIADDKRNLVYGRVVRVLRAKGLREFSQYLEIVKAGDTEAKTELINALTTNFTSFFREKHHFEFLQQQGIRQMMAAQGASKKLRAWSAGCSSGEEPYTLGMTVLESDLARAGWDFKLLATDLDEDILARAERGVYRSQAIADLSTAQRKRFFYCGTGEQVGYVRVKPELHQLVTFRKLNLMDSWPIRQKFDLIFCRNVMIYFSAETQTQLIRRFAAQLHPHGYLMIGHSETIDGAEDILTRVDKRAYQPRR